MRCTSIVVQRLLQGSEQPGHQVCLGDLYICLIIVVKFIGLGRGYRLRGDFEFIKSVWQATKGWGHFHGESWPLKAPCKDYNLVIVGRLGWMKWVKMGQGNVYISCNYSCTISFLVNILLIKLTLSWRRAISYRNQSIDLLHKSMDWFLYDIGLRHERVKVLLYSVCLNLNHEKTK